MEVNIAPGVGIDAQQAVTGRGCVIGQSGSGKSYLVGVIAEELCRLGLPFCIVDTEGEYSALKNSFAVLRVGGEGADIGLDTDMALLFTESVSYGVPVVLDVSESMDRGSVLERALSALYDVESKARKPYLVMVEEADKFAPQVTRQKMNMVEELSVRGRKRGIGLLVATQRPSSISKNVLAQCSYGFVGKLVIENDMRAVSTLFGGGTDLKSLATQSAGEFTPFGIPNNGRFRTKARTTVAKGGTPVVALGSAARERLDAMIRELSAHAPADHTAIGHGERMRPGNVTAQGGVFMLSPNFGADYAKEYAEKNESKRFGILGKRTESLEDISETFVALALAKIGMPTGRRGEYEERYLLLDDRMRIVNLAPRVSFVAARKVDAAELSKKDLDVLAEITSKHRVDIASLQKDTGMGAIALDHALERLESGGLVALKGNKVASKTGATKLMREAPKLARLSAPTLLLNYEVDEGAASDRVRALFPNAAMLEFTRVYLQVYEVRLRRGSRVRVLLIDSLNGSELIDVVAAR